MELNFYLNDRWMASEDFSFNPTGIIIVGLDEGPCQINNIEYNVNTRELCAKLIPLKNGVSVDLNNSYDPAIPCMGDIRPTMAQWRKFKSFGEAKLAAVKYIKEEFQVGLKEAKDYADEYFKYEILTIPRILDGKA